MNYLRGAVNAISAPYQYYKDINPSTLTGAIDVIVISRPNQHVDDKQSPSSSDKPADDNELVCSPFHVRFGKWQVLRPGDKKVNVFVNGNAVPFPMKIGEAGEAFFVFETDEEISEDIATSPLLEATKPGQTNAQVAHPGRFGTKEGADNAEDEIQTASQEPEFLDLNASPQDDARPLTSHTLERPPSQSEEELHQPSLLARTAQLGKTVVAAAVEIERSQAQKLSDKTISEAVSEVGKDQQTLLQEKAVTAENVVKRSVSDYLPLGNKGDEVLPVDRQNVEPPEVVYTDRMVFDSAGYHAHQHTYSAEYGAPSDGRPSFVSEPSSPEMTPGPSRSPSPSPSMPTESSSAPPGPVPFPSMRAASEPPPEGDLRPQFAAQSPPIASSSRSPSKSGIRANKSKVVPRASLRELNVSTLDVDTPQYVWEWGNFPQKTPVETDYRIPFPGVNDSLDTRKGKGRMYSEVGTEAGMELGELLAGVGKTPSGLSRSLTTDETSQRRRGRSEETKYGTGGRLTVDRRDPTLFRVFIEGKVAEFELSIIPDLAQEQAETKGGGLLSGKDGVEDARLFDQGKIDFQRFLGDDRLVHDENLVLKWAGDVYITRRDASPLMDALVIWRESARNGKLARFSSRSPSPGRSDERSRLKEIEEEILDRPQINRTSTDTSDNAAPATITTVSGQAEKASSSPWVRWWSRSRREASRPDLRPSNSAPPDMTRKGLEQPEVVSIKRSPSSASAPVIPPLDLHVETESPDVTPPPEEVANARRKRYAKTLRLTSEQLKSLNLQPGPNIITFSLSATGAIACTARLFLWNHSDRIVVSDIDGTITKSDALGHVFTMIGRDWTHLGVAKLYTDICRNGYKIMYLTSRAIGQADSTRDYLKGVKQNDYQLPDGPVIMSPDRLMASLHREVIMRKPEVFKMACLRDIQKLFGNTSRNPFYAGFGNRITDALSYRSVNVPSSRIFTIDSTGEVKMELLELAGYKSSYIHMTDLVDQMFPPIHRKWAAEFTDFNYWKPPMQEYALPDLTPPSPALSARSDSSNQSPLARLRNFSLVGSRQPKIIRPLSLPPPATEHPENGKRDQVGRKDQHLRQMSSLERLSNTLATLALSSSPSNGSPGSASSTYIDSGSEDEDDGDLEGQKKRRRRSTASMPGSLPGSRGSSDVEDELHFDMDEERGSEYDGEKEEEAAEETFDEDLLVTGEMQNVPFL
ncbi:Lipin/Ned1/Smp2-domain-containing protein [Sparassis latifolia]